VDKKFFLEIEQEQAYAGAINRVTGHQLRMRETLIDVFVDDVGLIKDEVTLNQNGYLPIGIHDVNVFGLVVQVDISDFEVHAFFEQYKAAAVGKWAGCT
jgi:hypothetical protein